MCHFVLSLFDPLSFALECIPSGEVNLTTRFHSQNRASCPPQSCPLSQQINTKRHGSIIFSTAQPGHLGSGQLPIRVGLGSLIFDFMMDFCSLQTQFARSQKKNIQKPLDWSVRKMLRFFSVLLASYSGTKRTLFTGDTPDRRLVD